MKLKKGKCWQMGLRYWEEFVKRNFNEEEHAEVNVPFPGLPGKTDTRDNSKPLEFSLEI